MKIVIEAENHGESIPLSFLANALTILAEHPPVTDVEIDFLGIDEMNAIVDQKKFRWIPFARMGDVYFFNVGGKLYRSDLDADFVYPARFIVGWNRAGYLPEMEPIECSSWEEAQEVIAGEIMNLRHDPDPMFRELGGLNTIKEAQPPVWEGRALGLEFWIQKGGET